MQKKIINLLKWLWIVAVLLGAGYYFYRNYEDISVYLKTISYPRLGISFILLFIGKLILSDLTRFSLKKVDQKISYKESLTITSITQLAKYLPGGIWHVAGKFGFYKARKMTTKKATQAILVENLWLLSSAIVIGIIAMVISSQAGLCELNAFFCQKELITILAVILPVAWVAGLLLFEKLFLKKYHFHLTDFLGVLVKLVVIWVAFGISYWLVFPAQEGFLIPIIGAFSLSWVAGYVAFFAPGGIGIREFLLTILLASFFASHEVAIYATIHRLLWILEEVLLGAGTALLFGIPINLQEETDA